MQESSIKVGELVYCYNSYNCKVIYPRNQSHQKTFHFYSLSIFFSFLTSYLPSSAFISVLLFFLFLFSELLFIFAPVEWIIVYFCTSCIQVGETWWKCRSSCQNNRTPPDPFTQIQSSLPVTPLVLSVINLHFSVSCKPPKVFAAHLCSSQSPKLLCSYTAHRHGCNSQNKVLASLNVTSSLENDMTGKGGGRYPTYSQFFFFFLPKTHVF